MRAFEGIKNQSDMAALKSYSGPFWPSRKLHNAAYEPGSPAHPQITHDLLRVPSDPTEALDNPLALGAE